MKVKTTLRDALADRRLLGQAMPGETWHVWRTILLATMGEPLADSELATFREVTGRETAPTERCEELVCVVGRRGGKSRAVAVLAAYLATLIDYSDALAAGERGLLLTVAPDLRQAGVVRGYVAGILAGSEVLRSLVESETSDTIRLTNGIDIESRAASWRRLRGVTLVAAVADESCFWHSAETSSNPDSEILAAIRPALATTSGLLAIISTPYSRRGATWELFSAHHGAEGDPSILVATGASATFNPALPARVIERAYERDPVGAASEYGALWRTDIAAFLTREAVTACVDDGVQERPYRGLVYRAFVDPSGGSNDSMTLAISHLEGDRAVLDLVREVRPPFSPEAVVAEFCATVKRYGLRTVMGDRYAGEWPRERFRKHGITYRVAELSASQLFLEALPLINAGRVSLLHHRRLVDQLLSLERRTSFTGRDTVGHPPGAHDDLAVAACGALLAVSARKATCWIGACGLGAGPVHWKEDAPRPRRQQPRPRTPWIGFGIAPH